MVFKNKHYLLLLNFLWEFLKINKKGGGIVGGEKVAEVEPFGAVGQSIAFFKDVFFSNSKKLVVK